MRFTFRRTEFGFGYCIIRSPYTPYSIYLRGDYRSVRSLGFRVSSGGANSDPQRNQIVITRYWRVKWKKRLTWKLGLIVAI